MEQEDFECELVGTGKIPNNFEDLKQLGMLSNILRQEESFKSRKMSILYMNKNMFSHIFLRIFSCYYVLLGKHKYPFLQVKKTKVSHIDYPSVRKSRSSKKDQFAPCAAVTAAMIHDTFLMIEYRSPRTASVHLDR